MARRPGQEMQAECRARTSSPQSSTSPRPLGGEGWVRGFLQPGEISPETIARRRRQPPHPAPLPLKGAREKNMKAGPRRPCKCRGNAGAASCEDPVEEPAGRAVGAVEPGAEEPEAAAGIVLDAVVVA